MNDKLRQRRDFIQNIIITVLTVFAVLLFLQTQFNALGPTSPLHRLLRGPGQNGANDAVQAQSLSAPVRWAVSSPYGRCAAASTLETDETLRGLLREALGSTGTFSACGKEDFLGALQEGVSVYFDFFSPLPLSVLAEKAGASAADETAARYLVLSGTETDTVLYVWDGGEDCRRCTTAVSRKTLDDTLAGYELGSAAFAMDLDTPNADALASCSLFLYETPALPILTALTPDYDRNTLLAGLGFNPNTKNSYTDNDTEVISEEGRSLRLRADGDITYQGGDGTLRIDSADTLPTLAEAADGAGTLVSSLLSASAGEEALYLTGVRRSGETTTVTFGYHSGGVPIRFSDGEDAACVTLDGAAVTALTLRVRHYAASQNDSVLLPLKQALAIAARYPGGELWIGYADQSGATVDAAWLAG